ncbi:MAG: peroxidase-related enzyme [Geminicoccaceae bacterium]|nr:peroxidase-related enzyme [Geminicoccaceae bacterium]MCS7267389.1 peroxidase-related enzyme [Geminicoccaceae bacterium]MCX7629510.1 peroxidase-related enzyme [Geminicoccaceae bacterium]MDW8123612.1 peroxidase-related enzyme [Geminicoccaceae bacterium]MDW8339953.1 peroxidase-related enzyme [Geminicoccaceae bacterium]
MPQPDRVHALAGVPVPTRAEVSEATGRYWDKCTEKLGLVPNVLKAYSFDDKKLLGFTTMYNELMLGESGLSKLEREMIAVVVSSINRCYYCLVAHGAAVRQLSGDPELGEMLVMNYRVAPLSPRERAMLDFAVKVTEASHRIEEADREALRAVGFSDRDIWDIAAVAAFFNMTNRMASAIGMMPNREYHAMARTPSPPAEA